MKSFEERQRDYGERLARQNNTENRQYANDNVPPDPAAMHEIGANQTKAREEEGRSIRDQLERMILGRTIAREKGRGR